MFAPSKLLTFSDISGLIAIDDDETCIEINTKQELDSIMDSIIYVKNIPDTEWSMATTDVRIRKIYLFKSKLLK